MPTPPTRPILDPGPLRIGPLRLALLALTSPACRDGSEAAPPATEASNVAGAADLAPCDRRSILLVTLDTTRADRLGCYGHTAASTPNLDALASDGVLFEQALTPVPVTLPAHAALLTGLLPHDNGVRDNGIYRLPPDLPTLAELLAEAGYDTAAVVGAAVLDRQYGLDRGFRRYDDDVAGGGLAIAERDAATVTDRALQLAAGLEPPFFLWVHYFDPHADYAPPAPFAERFRASPYDGEIAFVDEQLGRLRRELTRRGLMQGTVVAVAGDHGEGLGDHGEATHGVFLYQSTLRVPLLIVAPGCWPAGRRVSGLASLVDVAPSLLAFAGLTPPESMDGRLLTGTEATPGPPAAYLPLESEFGFNAYGWAPLRGITDGNLKWIDAPRPELYDLVEDPGEVRNRIDDHPAARERLAGAWKESVTADRRSRPEGDTADAGRAEQLDRLRALGYVGTARRRPSKSENLPDPKSAIVDLASINEARAKIRLQRYAEADALLQGVVQRSPGNLSALVLLGSARVMSGRPGDAVAPLQSAAALAPENADVQYNLGLAWLGTGDAERAEAAWREALRLAPRYHDAAANLVDLLLGTGRPVEADRVLREARSNQVDSAVLDYLEGKLALIGGNPTRARALLSGALRGSLPPAAAEEARAILRRLGPAG